MLDKLASISSHLSLAMSVLTHDNLSSHCSSLVCLSLNSDTKMSLNGTDRVSLNTFSWVFPRKFGFPQNWYKGSSVVLFADVSERKSGKIRTVTSVGCCSLIQPTWEAAVLPLPPSRIQSSVVPGLLFLQLFPSQISETVEKALKTLPFHLWSIRCGCTNT